jgi:hypothetical protein
MTTLNPLRNVIRTKLADGRLPTNGITRAWGILGNGETCDACNGIITKGQFVMNGLGVKGSRQPLQLHVACFRLWDEEQSALQNRQAAYSS